jgi:hypothetical protein
MLWVGGVKLCVMWGCETEVLNFGHVHKIDVEVLYMEYIAMQRCSCVLF